MALKTTTITRRTFLKGLGATIGAVGVAAVVPRSWVGALDRPLTNEPILPLHLLHNGERVAYGVASQTDTNTWSATFVPGSFEGYVDEVEYRFMGQTRIKPLRDYGGSVHILSSDSLEIIIRVEVSYA